MSQWLPWIDRAATRWPDATAYSDAAETRTFGELHARAHAAARRWIGAGVRPGDRLLTLLEPSATLVECLHASQLAGACLVPLNPQLGVDELVRLAVHADARWLVHDREHAALGARLAAATGAAAPDVEPAKAASLPRVGADDPLAIVYTSGTTAAPKGVVLSQRNFESGAEASAARLGCRPGDRWLAAMPMFHVGGLSIPVRCALVGMTQVQHPRFAAPEVVAALRTDRITHVSLVPTMLARLLDHGLDGRDCPQLRAAVIGGGRVPPSLVDRATAARVPLVATYGLTETAAQVTASTPGDAAAHPGSAGTPLAGVEITIDSPDGEGVGEVLVRAAQVTAGYWRDPERTAQARSGERWRTGDLGRLDSDGRLWIDVRRDDLIVTGGENVRPAAVEDVLRAHPAVADAGVCGLLDNHWGQRVAAAVVLRSGAHCDETELGAWCRDRLAPFQVPRAWRLVAALPRTLSGKLQRQRLAASWGEVVHGG